MSTTALNIKEIILGVLTIAVNLAAFWFWNKTVLLIAEGEFQSYYILISPIIWLLAAASLFVISCLFIRNNFVLYTLVFVIGGAPFLFVSATTVTMTAAALSIFLLFFATFSASREVALSLGFSLIKFSRIVLPLHFTMASLIISVLYFAQLNEERAVASFLPKSAFDYALKILAEPIHSLVDLPGFNLEATIDENLSNFLEDELKSQGIKFSSLPKETVAKLLTERRGELSKQYGLTLVGNEKMSDIFYSSATNFIQKSVGPYRYYLPFISAVAFFFTFKILAIPLHYITLLIAFILIRLMVFSKILKFEKQEIVVERLTL